MHQVLKLTLVWCTSVSKYESFERQIFCELQVLSVVHSAWPWIMHTITTGNEALVITGQGLWQQLALAITFVNLHAKYY